MGIFNRLFRRNQSDIKVILPEGFYVIRYEYGENQARMLFQKAQAGDVSAQLAIAECFMQATEHSYALPWYEIAAENGSSQALHELTYFYEGRYVDIQANPIKAKEVRDKALGMNNPKAILKLASQYYTGDGVEMNKEKAFQYYLKAAQLGSNEGMAEVGLCYLKGEGVDKNDSLAFEWLSRSKDGRYRSYHLAQCYLKGIGTKKDIEKAVTFLEDAVNCRCLEMSQARSQLVDLYSRGYGGIDATKKLQKIKVDIEKSDDLLGRLANLILSEEE